ncbi:predicted protein [Histoplasma capsulatum var. duboisii H88]|uniref:Predicted protein n=2 Tax=Ajellomyces capsulatus TaxID=5037 RepID=F0U5F5_AJEC8|nr:predicted protein [Histoplasma capsulatum H143]EGC41303.1 predicted protein [Histoplasma capsulatum var. duboisii H88]
MSGDFFGFAKGSVLRHLICLQEASTCCQGKQIQLCLNITSAPADLQQRPQSAADRTAGGDDHSGQRLAETTTEWAAWETARGVTGQGSWRARSRPAIEQISVNIETLEVV